MLHPARAQTASQALAVGAATNVGEAEPQVKTIVTLTLRHGEDHPSSPALSRRPPLVIIHPDAQHSPRIPGRTHKHPGL